MKPSSYCEIISTSSLRKLFSTLFHVRIDSAAEKKKLISQFQVGFRERYST